MQILVVGMHRSGTSMVTRLLNLAGAYFGGESDGTGVVNAENPKGFWERSDVRRVNERMLATVGADWDRITPWLAQSRPAAGNAKSDKAMREVLLKIDAHRPWVIKDPRLCLTLPAWLERLERPHLVMPLRDPAEVALSLQRRNGFPLDVGLALWEGYMTEALRGAGRERPIIVRYDTLMQDAPATVRALIETLRSRGVDRLHAVDDAEVLAFIDPSLYRSRAPDLGAHYREHPAMALFARLCSGGTANTDDVAAVSDRSMEELLRHEARQAKQRASQKVPWQELRNSVVAATGSVSAASTAEAVLARMDDEIAIAGGRAADRLRDVRGHLQQLQSDHHREMEARASEAVSQRSRIEVLEAQVQKLDSSLVQAHEQQAVLRDSEAVLNVALVRAQEDARCAHADLQAALARHQDVARELDTTRTALHAFEADLAATRAHLDAAAADSAMVRSTLETALNMESGQHPMEMLLSAAVHRTQTLSVLEPRLQHAETLLGSLRGLQQKLDAVVLSVQSLRTTHDATGNDYKQVRSDFAALLASLGWRTGHRFTRIAERLLLRKSAWMAHQNLDLVLRRIGGELRSGGAIISVLRRDSAELADAVRALASQASLPSKALVDSGSPARTSVQNGEGIFSRHLRRISDAAARNALADRYRAADAAPPDTARLRSQRPLVSIVMPTYNRAALILDAIRSVLEQTYDHWELLVCDDGSTDDTVAQVESLGESRIRVLRLPHAGAAAARNGGLQAARGRYIAYLDTDNLWHAEYLERCLSALSNAPGRLSAYSDYVDVKCDGDGYQLRSNRIRSFSYEALTERNYIDLNGFVHDAALLSVLGGFTSTLTRQQDWDLVLKMTYLRDPLMLSLPLVLYRRNEQWGQITIERKNDTAVTSRQVLDNVASYYAGGLAGREWRAKKPRLTVLSWDVCRNHYSKAYNLAEAAGSAFEPRLVGFHFFGAQVFEPYRGEAPAFGIDTFAGGGFPEFFEALTRAWARIDGDMVYCVKPRLPSLGLALLANFHTGVPIVLESNDSEAHVGDPQRRDAREHGDTLALGDCALEDLLNPYSDAWSRVMDGYARDVPIVATHNHNLDRHHGGTGYYIRNLKDERHYDPAAHDRDAIRRELGYGPEDRVILFGGLLRKHKGIHELVELVRSLGDPRYKLLFVGSRVSPDQEQFERLYAEEIRVLPPQGRNRMAQINLAADLVVLWLDPRISASHYQMPYKFTDAIAMRVPVIANDISDLGPLAAQGYLKLAEFGDFDALRLAVRELFDQPEATAEMVAAARNLYLRQFSYAAANTMLRVLYEHADAQRGVLPVAERFARDFAQFRARVFAATPVAEVAS